MRLVLWFRDRQKAIGADSIILREREREEGRMIEREKRKKRVHRE